LRKLKLASGPRARELLEYDFKIVRNKVTKMKRELIENYYAEKLNSVRGDHKRTWQVVNQVLYNDVRNSKSACKTLLVEGREILDPSHIAELLNKFFASVGDLLSRELPPISPCKYTPSC